MTEKKYIGSTDISGIVGTSPFVGPWEVMGRLTRTETEDRMLPHFKMGWDMEPYLLKAVEDMDRRWLVLFGIPDASRIRVKPGVSFYSDAGDGAAPTRSTPDGKIVLSARHRTPLISIEAKTAFYSDNRKWSGELRDYDDWEGSEEPLRQSVIPAHYNDQAQWHMKHDKTNLCLLPVMFNYTSAAKIYAVARDDERIAFLTSKANEFWARYIVGDETPAADASDGMKTHMNEQEAYDLEFKDADPIHEEYLDRLSAATESAAKAEKEVDTYKNLLRAAIANKGGIGLKFNGSYAGRISNKPNKKGQKTLSTKGAKKCL